MARKCAFTPKFCLAHRKSFEMKKEKKESSASFHQEEQRQVTQTLTHSLSVHLPHSRTSQLTIGVKGHRANQRTKRGVESVACGRIARADDVPIVT